jgi:hypothetical protein
LNQIGPLKKNLQTTLSTQKNHSQWIWVINYFCPAINFAFTSGGSQVWSILPYLTIGRIFNHYNPTKTSQIASGQMFSNPVKHPEQ